MRRIIITSIALLGIFYACNISVVPQTASGVVGDSLEFKVIVKNIHLPCLLAIEATQFKFDKVSLQKESDWDSVNVTTFEKKITVRLDRAGQGFIDASRTCPIRTSTAKATIEIKEKYRAKELTAILEEAKILLKAFSDDDTSKLHSLRSLKESLSNHVKALLKEKDQTEIKKQITRLKVQLEKVLILADSLRKTCEEALKELPK
ncbi:MAG: hypothetical protein ABIK93_00205 [candidate division WOR-3 bacterium]